MEKKYKVLMGVLVIIVLALLFFLVYSLMGNQKETPSTTDNSNIEQQEQTEEEQVLEAATSMNPEGTGEYEIVEKTKRENNETVYVLEDVNNKNKNDLVEESNDNIEIEEVTINEELEDVKTYEEVNTVPVDPIVYDGLTMNQLAEKLNRSLNSTISGKGYLIASYSLQLGIDPYMATAIILHETGCNGTCSSLVRECNNVGGQKGGPSCGGGAYKAYPTLDEGIMGYLDNLYRNYYSYGLTTPETIGPKYAASTTWASQVNNYIALIISR